MLMVTVLLAGQIQASSSVFPFYSTSGRLGAQCYTYRVSLLIVYLHFGANQQPYCWSTERMEGGKAILSDRPAE